jgi:hypothetical protein
MPNPLRILHIDIETAPMAAFVWSPWDSFLPMDRLIHDTFLLTWAGKWDGEKKMYSDALTSKEALSRSDVRIAESLADLVRQADIVVGHNLDKFDIPKLNGRLLQNKLEPIGPVQTIDTLKLAKKSIKIAFNKLDYLGEFLGLGRKIKTDFQLWEDSYNGDEQALAKMLKYNKQDVILLEHVFHALIPYSKQLTRLMEPGIKGDTTCPFCGGNHLKPRGYYRTQASTFVKLRCEDCGKYSRERKSIPEKYGVHPL